MIHAVNIVLSVAAALMLIPVGVFSIECLLSLLPRRRNRGGADGPRPRVAVLIPAHNEESVVGRTLDGVKRTLKGGDRVLVVADNCNDGTADVARAHGAEVVERFDDEARGKPWALDAGRARLSLDPPDVVFVLDADCDVDPQAIDLAARTAVDENRCVQTLNLSAADEGASSIHVVSELGFRFKNLVRPLGLARVGLPCHLMGTGMALPWEAFKQAPLGGDHLAEDMHIGVDLAIAGFPTRFSPEAGVTSRLPSQDSGFMSQRTRWEQGHLKTSLTQIPRLLRAAILKRRIDLFALAADLTVPPLSLLVVTWFAAAFVTAVCALFGASWTPALALVGGGSAMALSVLAGWAVHCRSQVPVKALATIPWYILRKIPIYFTFFLHRRQTEWVRTERDDHAKLPASAGTCLPPASAGGSGRIADL